MAYHRVPEVVGMDDETMIKALEELEHHIESADRWSDWDSGYVYGIVHALLMGLDGRRQKKEPAE